MEEGSSELVHSLILPAILRAWSVPSPVACRAAGLDLVCNVPT